mmetsp:Transcript_10674/g.19694  ORF Transcript_10674/g.19694 Transcript_10674/m.19694 type:complete len:109 (+) Transcript_10674:137-463(+)
MSFTLLDNRIYAVCRFGASESFAEEHLYLTLCRSITHHDLGLFCFRQAVLPAHCTRLRQRLCEAEPEADASVLATSISASSSDTSNNGLSIANLLARGLLEMAAQTMV